MRLAQVAVPAFVVGLLAIWLIVDPRTPDLAAQVYRADLFQRLGFVVWDERWYAGHQMPAYSLLFPPLGSLLGVRLLGALTVLASTLLFERLVLAVYGERARWGAAFFALAAVGEVWSGQVTFALGVPLALAAVSALRRGYVLLAVLAALASAAASPVAGALLALAALTWSIERREWRALLVLGVPPLLLVGALALLFPEGGVEPYPILSFAATAVVMVGFLPAVPSEQRMLRVGGALYLVVCVACLLIHSPVGSNVERYGVLLAGPLLLCATAGGRRGGGPLRRAALVVALGASAVWVVWGPVRETRAVAGSAATSAAYYEPLERFLASREGPVRVEVPLTRSHWEAALLAPSVSLARGWEKQLESKYDEVLLAHGLSAASYEHWLREQAVSYVALPDVTPDPSSAQEARLIRGGLPYLREVFSSAHWKVYAVANHTPLAAGPGRLNALGVDSFTLQASARGRFLVRVHYSRYLELTSGSGCVDPAPGGWTWVSVKASGRAVVQARFSLGRAFASGGSCSG